MQEYYFLFALALVFTIAATFQDLKTREVSNWLNFSLIAFALAYRAFYAVINQNLNFFLFGIAGFIIFFALAHLFYYIKAFAGGDAKLLMGYGVILPFSSYASLFTLTIAFILLLFTIGAIYSLVYSIFIVVKNKTKFKKEFSRLTKKQKHISLFSLLLSILLLLILSSPTNFILSFLFLIPMLYTYTLALDKCMISLVSPSQLTEGDWLVNDIKLKNKIIKKTVHGLSKQDIRLLKKHKKIILIKQGIPFTPAFLISLIIIILISTVFSSITSLFPFSFFPF